MSVNPRPPSKGPFSEPTISYEFPNSTMFSKEAIVERLPFALDYAASLEPGDHAVLFYDNLVAAAEYFCAFIEEGIRRRELTCITGLESRLYRGLFEQVGIRVAELESCGYLRNLSTEESYNELGQIKGNESGGNSVDPLHNRLGGNAPAIRFVHVHESRNQKAGILRDVMEDDRRTHNYCFVRAVSICCYDAKFVLEDAPAQVFTELLKTHNHCLFQGIAMQTSKLLGPQANAVYSKLRSA